MKVGGFGGHLDVVRVTLLERRRRDAYEAALLLQLGDRTSADVEHRLVEATDQLVRDGGERTAEGDLSLDALGHDLVVAGDLGLEVAILGVGLLAAAAHGSERAHAPVGLELLAVDEHDLAGRLLDAGQHRADHDGVGAGDQRLGDVAGLLEASVGDDGHAGGLARQRCLVDGRDLRDATTGDDASRADRARTEADLDRVGAGIDERLRTLTGRDVAADDLHVLGRGVGLESLHDLEQHAYVTVCRVGDEHVDTGLDERGRALPGIAEVADRGADHESSVSILGRVGELLGLHEVLDRDEAGQSPGVIDERQALALVLAKEQRGVLAGDAFVSGDQRHLGHDLVDLGRCPFGDRGEPQVTVGDDAEQSVVGVDDRETGHAVLATDPVEVLKRRVGTDRHGVGDDARLGALHQVDLVGLVVEREVAVENADATFAGHRDGHAGLGDGVHRRADERHLQADARGSGAPSCRSQTD